MRKLFFAIFLVLSVSLLYPSDLFLQKVILVPENNSAFYNFNIMLAKAALSSPLNGKNIIVIDGEPGITDRTNFQHISGIITLNTLSNTNGFFIELHDNEGKELPYFTPIPLDPDKIVDSLPDIGDKIIKGLESIYKPMHKEEIIQVEKVVVNYSEFEPLKPLCKLTLGPEISFNGLGISISTYSNGNSWSGGSIAPAAYAYSLAAEILLEYHEWSFFAAGSAGLPIGNDNFRIGLGYGLFGSILILGLEGIYYGECIQPGGYFSYSSWGSGIPTTYQVLYPEVFLNSGGAGIVIKINITTNYSLELRAGGLFWAQENLVFNNPVYNNLTLNGNTPPVLSFRINLRLFPGYMFNLDFTYLNVNNYYNSGNGFNNSSPLLNSSSGYYLSSLTLSQSIIELGISYEL